MNKKKTKKNGKKQERKERDVNGARIENLYEYFKLQM
jgi:hypothetical protein